MKSELEYAGVNCNLFQLNSHIKTVKSSLNSFHIVYVDTLSCIFIKVMNLREGT